MKNQSDNPEEERRKEIERILQDTKPPKLESIPDADWNSFLQPIAEMPDPIKNKFFYFEELLSWMYNGYKSLRHEIYTKQDYLKRYTEDSTETFSEPYVETWENLTADDLVLEDEPAKDRLFYNSPSHHVFLLSLLELVKQHPYDFVETYVVKKSIDKMLEGEKYEGEYKCINLIIDDLAEYLDNKNYQLIPPLWHIHGHGLIMSKDLRKASLYDLGTEDCAYEFGFSKQSSDRFTQKLIEALRERQHFINHITQKTNVANIQQIPSANKKTIQKKESMSFEKLFYEVSNAGKIIDILKRYDVLNKAGNWKGFTNNKTEILALIEVLLEKRYIQKYSKTPIGRIFCDKFSIDIKDRSLRAETKIYYEYINEYMRIIPDLTS